MANKNVDFWSVAFRALGSPYRLHILKLLKRHGKMSVTDITQEIGISMKNTSRNLKILKDVGFLKSQGKSDRVFYEINPELDTQFGNILKTFIS